MRSEEASYGRLTVWERAVLVLLLALVIAFGIITEIRCAFLSRRMGDLGCFLRGAWAIRDGGEQLYRVTCDNSWHYNYPPLLAILMTPLADPPRGAEPIWAVPYAWSVAIWYGVSVAALFWGVHNLATALQPRLPAGGRAWWILRAMPIVVVLSPIGTTLTKGQVNTVVLAAICGWLAETIRGRGLRAGLYLSFAIAVKVTPAYLLLLPLVRRDVRCFAGAALGLFIGLVAVPTAVLGPEKTVACYREFVQVTLAPGLGVGGDESRRDELTSVNGTDSQSFLTAIHNTIYPNPFARPRDADPPVRWAHAILSALVTGATLIAFRKRSSDANEAIFGGALMLLTILVSPVSHLHYFVFALPLAMGTIAATRGRNAYPPFAVAAALVAFGLAIASPSIPLFAPLRDKGIAVYAALALWSFSLVVARTSAGAIAARLDDAPARAAA